MCIGPPTTLEWQRQNRAIERGTLATIAALLEGEPDVPVSWTPCEPIVGTGTTGPRNVVGWERRGQDWEAEVSFRSDMLCWQWRARARIGSKVERACSIYDAQRPLVSRAEAFRMADEWLAERGMT